VFLIDGAFGLILIQLTEDDGENTLINLDMQKRPGLLLGSALSKCAMRCCSHVTDLLLLGKTANCR
jgi:hypothetical protein